MHGFLLVGNVYAVRNAQRKIHTRCGKLCGSCGNPLMDGKNTDFHTMWKRRKSTFYAVYMYMTRTDVCRICIRCCTGSFFG